MHLVSNDRANTSFILEGKQNAPVLVIANSMAATPEMWDAQIKSWAQDFQLLRYSYRGHGKTPALGEDLSVADLANDLFSLLDQLNIHQFHYVGLSLGAMLGLYVAAKYPQRIKSLVAANFKSFQTEATCEIWEQRISLVREKGVDAIADGTVDRWLTASFRQSHPEVDDQIRAMVRSTSTEGYIACCKAVRDYDARLFMAQIECPVLLISGLEDVAAPAAEFAEIQAAIKNSVYLPLNAAHLSNVECPDQFSSAVLGFIKKNS